MQIEEQVDGNDMRLIEGELLPPTVPILPPVDLRALAAQLPDLSSLDNLTVNIQANNFLQPHDNTQHIQALAHNTDARLGHLRDEVKLTLEKGNACIAERFRTLGGWC
jgi:hypothetical protein